MNELITAKICGYDGEKLIVLPSVPIDHELLEMQCEAVEIRLNDGRNISAKQRKKIFATIQDIAKWSGDNPEYIRYMLTWDFCKNQDKEYFSLSDVDMTTARNFINYLIDFCLSHGVPCSDYLINRTDDIDYYLYCCLKYRRCCICGRKAQVHHVTGSKIGMGGNRRKIEHVGRKAVALCWKHHSICHNDEELMFKTWHVYGLPLDEKLVKRLNL